MAGLQRKTIKKIIQKKVDEWLKSIDDKEVRKMAERDVIVTGGSIASMLLNEPVNDFDLYFRTQETTQAVARYYVDKFNATHPDSLQPEVRTQKIDNIRGETEERVVIWVVSDGVASENGADDHEYGLDEEQAEEYVNSVLKNDDDNQSQDDEPKSRYRPVFLSENAITLSDKVQIVIRFYGEPSEIHDNYDFVHATCYYDHANKELVMPSEALELILSKTLKYRGSLYPVCSIFRARKFIQKGWKISAGEMLKMALQVSEIDLTNVSTLKEQLTGVDAAYFHQLIRIIEDYRKKAIENGDAFSIGSTYVASIIEEIFDKS